MDISFLPLLLVFDDAKKDIISETTMLFEEKVWKTKRLIHSSIPKKKQAPHNEVRSLFLF